MTKWMIAIAAAAIVGFIFYRLKLFIRFRYYRIGGCDELTVTVCLYQNYVLYQIRIPVIEMETQKGIPDIVSEIETNRETVRTHPKREYRFVSRLLTIYLKYPQRWKKVVKKLNDYNRAYSYYSGEFKKRVHCEKLDVSICCGGEDAAMTALMTGVLSALINWRSAAMKQEIHFVRPPQVTVRPCYSKACFTVDFMCILRLTVGDVMITTISTINYNRKGAGNNV